jgi:uncharacterized protein (UPF0332 family)
MSSKANIPIDQENANKLMSQFLDYWINPEIKRRIDKGILSQDYKFEKAQVIFCLGNAPIIRLGNEVKVQLLVRVNRSISKGEKVYESDVSEIAELKNIPEEEDFAFLIVIRLGNMWHMAFNFEHSEAKSKGFLSIGETFLDSAKNEHKKGNIRQAIELLLIAGENLIKSRLYLLPEQRIRGAKTHQGTQMMINSYAREGNIFNLAQSDAINQLTKVRDDARYSLDFKFDGEKLEKHIQSIEIIASVLRDLLAVG